MMTCRELTEFLEHYLAGELPAPVLRVFDHHLALCVNCVRYVSQYRDTIASGRRAFADLDVPVPRRKTKWCSQQCHAGLVNYYHI